MKIKIWKSIIDGKFAIYDPVQGKLGDKGDCWMTKSGEWYAPPGRYRDDLHKTRREAIRTLKKFYPHAKKLNNEEYEI